MEYGFCGEINGRIKSNQICDFFNFLPDGSPEPASLDKISIEPFPVIVQTGATVTLDSQVLMIDEKHNWEKLVRFPD